MTIRRRFWVRSAYGQLVLIVFLPIAVLASVGAVLVFFETHRALRSEQDVLAQAALIRYEPVIRPLLPELNQDDYVSLQAAINELGFNGVTGALSPIKTAYHNNQHYQMHYKQHVQRVAILDETGKLIIASGVNKDSAWGQFDLDADGIWRMPTDIGTAYGMPIYSKIDNVDKKFWLFVDMDNEPLTIAYYRILLAMAITGLTTILLLLLILSFYSKRWIAPIYEMRLYLQRLTVGNLNQTLNVKSDGEFYLLKKDLNHALIKLDHHFRELKRHSEQTEADLQQAFDEMEMQNISIRQAHDLMVSSNEAKSAFLANISHELRTPLNAIDGFINLLARDGKLDSKQMLYVQTIKKSSAHLLALINDVLDFSKIEAGKLILSHQKFNLYESIYEVADMMSPLALEKRLRMSVLFYHDVPLYLLGDNLRVKQILTNLVGNAIKFTDTGGVAIKVVLDDDDMVRISVEDSGRGIDKSSQDQLFQSFSQGDLSVTRRYGGTGLGLVISKQLTHLMQGQIGFFDNAQENIASSGTTFWFTMPIGLPYDGMENCDELDNLTKLAQDKKLLAWINHEASVQVLTASLSHSPIELTYADSLARLLEVLSEQKEQYDWVIVDSFGQKGDLTALLRQVRLHYQGRLLVFGYQVGLDGAMLAHYQAQALYEPLDKIQLYQLISCQHHEPVRGNLSAWHGVKVLAVDDHAPNLLVLEALLGELGIETIKAESGFDAIEIMTRAYAAGKVGADCIDLIFMDISMPMMSGFEAASAIRKVESAYHKNLSTPIIALTAHGLSDEKAQLVKAGLDDYAVKPIAQNELIELLKKWLGKSRLAILEQTHDKADLAVTTHADVPADDVTPNETHDDIIKKIQAMPVADWQDALSRAANKPDLAKKLLTMMIQSVINEKTALNAAWQNSDRATLAQVAHRIVGAARYTGVPQLRSAAQYFEEQCLLQVDFTLPSHLATLKPAFDVLLLALDKVSAVSADEVVFNEGVK